MQPLTEEGFDQLDSNAPIPSRIAGTPGIWGVVGDNSRWNAVFRLYDQDKLEGAHELVQNLGIGQSGGGLHLVNLIDAEYALRVGGVSRELPGSVTIEYIAGE